MKRAVLDNLLKEIDRFEHWKKKMKWCMGICHAVREQNIDEARRLVYQAEHQKLNITCFGKPISESLILHIFPRLKELDPLHIAYCLSKKCMEDGTSRKGIEGLMIHLCQVGKFTSDVLERWLQEAIMFGFHDLAYHLIVTHKVNCNTPVDISYLTAPSSVQLSPFELAAKLKQHRMQTWMANRDDVKKWQNDVKKAHNDLKKAQKEAQKKERQAQKEEMQVQKNTHKEPQKEERQVQKEEMQVQKNTHKEPQKEERQVQKEERQAHKEERQAHVDYANTILVGAVLIAGLAYQGWLEPPSGFDENGYAWVYRDSLALQLFWVFNSLSFFLAVVTVISAGMGAIPSNKKEHLADAVTRARDPVSLASICFPMSIICTVIAFASAGFAILPYRMNRYQSIMIGTVLCGAINCYILIMMFIKRNSKIYPSPINSIKMNPINAKTMRTFFRKNGNFLKKGAFLLIGFCSGTIFLFCIVLPVSLIVGLLFLLQKLGKLCACLYLEEAVETALGVIFISVGVIFTFFSKYLYMKDFCDYIF